jgi:hypothetical protein
MIKTIPHVHRNSGLHAAFVASVLSAAVVPSGSVSAGDVARSYIRPSEK